MEIQTRYNPADVEEKWYQYWQNHQFFRSTPDEREPYTIVIPPPNVTGVLHMGHILNNTIQDILVRRARMQGKNTLWLPGTDHASIATEKKVVDKLKLAGINKFDLTRDEFLKHAWEWTEKHGGIILEQLKKLGASCDWERTKFTMDDDLSESVIDVFIDLYRKGKIYRGVRMINWDPQAKTAVSDEEVFYKEVQSKLWYIKYAIVDSNDEFITIATTRPETILGDTAICVHPEDERYSHLRGKKAIVPLVNREVPIIFDEYVTKEFGTGALKVTPAHDINDYHLALKYQLEIIDIFTDDGKLNEKAQFYVGKDRFEARELVAQRLGEKTLIVKIENYTNKIGFSERTDAIIEPKLSTQWFLKMKELVPEALENVLNDNIQLRPEKFKNVYRHWMENVHDWCISRQLWWGHRIPAYYLKDETLSKEVFVAKTIEEALEQARKLTRIKVLTIKDLYQEEDVLDTWFSSWLWPISVFDGIRHPENPDIKYYYPTNDLVTAPEILFFWVARMIMAGYEYRNEKPFKNVYLTGTVRDGLGRKMSKSLGNSPDPLELISRYGADAVRIGMMFCSPAGNDLIFDMKKDAKTNEETYPLCEQGRNFANKIWNAFRLVKMWNIDNNISQPESAKNAILWFENYLNKVIAEIDELFKDFRISEALMTVYKLFWDDFASWFLEMVKPAYQMPIDSKTYESTIQFFDSLLRLLHPFMPFISEEIWQMLEQRKDGESIVIAQMPVSQIFDNQVISRFEEAREIVANIRTIRQEKNLSPKESLILEILAEEEKTGFSEIIKKLSNISEIRFVKEKPQTAIAFLVKSTDYYVPLSEKIDIAEEISKFEKELKYFEGFRDSILMKLSNEKFVLNAKNEILEKERTKLADAESKIYAINEQIARLK